MRQKKLTKEMCVRMAPEDWDILEKASEMTGQSCSQCLRQLVRIYLAPQIKSGVVFPGKSSIGPVNMDMFEPASAEEEAGA